MELLRLRRNVEIKNQIFLTLEQQKEIALVEEIKKMPVLNILDKAVKPHIIFKPKKRIIVLIACVLGVFFSFFLVLTANLFFNIVEEYYIKSNRVIILIEKIFGRK